MKKWMTMLMFAAAAVIAPVAANAGALRASVEHDFVVNGKTLPAGTYLLVANNDNGVAIVRAVEGKPAAIVMTRTQNNVESLESHLAFQQLDGKFYLVSYATNGSGYDVANSPRAKSGGTLSLVKAVVVK